VPSAFNAWYITYSISAYGDLWPTESANTFSIDIRPANSATVYNAAVYSHGTTKTQQTTYTEPIQVYTGDEISVKCTNPGGVPLGAVDGGKGYTITLKLTPGIIE